MMFKFTKSELATMSEAVAKPAIEALRDSRVELSAEPEVRFAADEALLKIARQIEFDHPQRTLTDCIRRAVELNPALAALSRAPTTRDRAAIRGA